MKRTISIILVIFSLLSLSIRSFAAEKDFVLTYSNESSYEIIIPSSIDIDPVSSGGEINIEFSDLNLAENTEVSVIISSDNFDDLWYLVDTEDSNNKIADKIEKNLEAQIFLMGI